MGTNPTGASASGGDAVEVRHQTGSRPEEVIVTVAGELDAATATSFRGEIDKLIDAGARDVVMEAEAMTFIDSSGLRVLVDLLDRLRDAGGSIRISSLSPPARKVFEVTGLTGLFSL